MTSELKAIVVITEKSPYGDIAPEEFKEITGEDF